MKKLLTISIFLTVFSMNAQWTYNPGGTGVQTITNTASGLRSIAMGYFTTASGELSTAMGSNNTASGLASTAMGQNNTASDYASTAMGRNTNASGVYSTSMGFATTASGERSTAMGRNTNASDFGSLSIGSYNTIQTTNATAFDPANRALVIGNGTSAGNRSDALTVLFDGTTTIAGSVTAPSFIGDGSQLTNAGTDDQQLSLNVNSLELEDGGTVDLSTYLDNTDDQVITYDAVTNVVTLEDGGTIDLSALNNSGTDDQQLTLAGNSLNLEDGGTVDLSGYLDNTDDQNLGNFILSEPLLSIAISGGNSVTVNLSPLLQDLENENAAQQAQIDAILAVNVAQQALIDDLIARMEARELCECNGPLGVGDFNAPADGARLLQNVPNPFANSTSIGYFIPLNYSKANIVISTTLGQILQNIPITRFGDGSISVEKDRMSAAIYFYTLYVDGKQIDTKRMLVE